MCNIVQVIPLHIGILKSSVSVKRKRSKMSAIL